MDRRQFLEFSAASLSVATIASGSLVLSGCGGGSSGAGSSVPSTDPKPDNNGNGSNNQNDALWQTLAASMSGSLIRPGNSNYDLARVVFNARFDDIKPRAIALCASENDITQVLAFAQKNKLAITPRCGGHSYTATSNNNGIVIDVTPLNKITVGAGTATVGAGARLADVYDQLTAVGVAIPMGSCLSVGIAGLTLGGGIGIVDRAYGLTCDNLISARVITADGKLVIADANQNSDLFWALRGGGGGNFGVVSEFTFKTHTTSDITVFEANFNFDDFSKVMAAWQAWPATLPDTIWGQVQISWFNPSLAPVLYLRAFCLGSKADTQPYWNQLLSATQSRTISSSINTDSYRNTMLGFCSNHIASCHISGQFPGGTIQRNAFAASSDFFDQSIPDAGWLTLKNFIAESQKKNNLGMIIADLMGGKIAQFKPEDTAFIHRNSLFSFEYYTYFQTGTSNTIVDQAQAWEHQFRDIMKPWSSGRAYVNYLDPLITDWKQAYYGSNYPRLAGIKAKYDPSGVFKMAQGIEST